MDEVGREGNKMNCECGGVIMKEKGSVEYCALCDMPYLEGKKIDTIKECRNPPATLCVVEDSKRVVSYSHLIKAILGWITKEKELNGRIAHTNPAYWKAYSDGTLETMRSIKNSLKRGEFDICRVHLSSDD